MNKVSKKQRGQSRNGQNQYEDVVDEIKIELLDVKEVCNTVLGNTLTFLINRHACLFISEKIPSSTCPFIRFCEFFQPQYDFNVVKKIFKPPRTKVFAILPVYKCLPVH